MATSEVSIINCVTEFAEFNTSNNKENNNKENNNKENNNKENNNKENNNKENNNEENNNEKNNHSIFLEIAHNFNFESKKKVN